MSTLSINVTTMAGVGLGTGVRERTVGPQCVTVNPSGRTLRIQLYSAANAFGTTGNTVSHPEEGSALTIRDGTLAMV